MKKIILIIFAYACFQLAPGCTLNPFGGDDIASGKRNIKGEVVLSDLQDSKDDIYVWLEGFNIGARTNDNGEFQITLPPPGSQGSTGGADGLFRLFFYVANYHLSSSEILVQDGEFVYAKAGINKDGELFPDKLLSKKLVIETEVRPAVINRNSNSIIQIIVKLRALGDSISVVFPNSIGGFLGAAFLKNLATEQVFIIDGPPTSSRDVQIITREESSRSLLFDLIVDPLPVGKFEVVPYLLVEDRAIPPELMLSLGTNVTGLNQNYLNIPFKGNVAILEVTNQ
jgi:hypothetical protein